MSSSPTPPEFQEPATNIRHGVVAVATCMALIMYLDRFCVNISQQYIKEDLGLSETQMSWFISSFFWTYALCQVPAGWLGDRWGIRGVLALYILAWSVFTGGMGLAQGAFALLAMRMGCGIAQAGAFPASGSLLRRWVPFSSRGVASAIVALGGRLGAVIAPILTTALMIAFVPLSTPAKITPEQVLSAQGVARKLVAGPGADSSPSPAGHLWSLLSPADQQELQSLASSDPELTSTHDHAGRVATLLNGLLERTDLFDATSRSRLPLEREATRMLARVERGESLDPVRQQRFGRFVLEGVFRNEVGKLYVQGWRPVVVCYGLAGVAVAALFWWIFRDYPAQHPRCNRAEQALIDPLKLASASTLDRSGPSVLSPPPLLAMLRSSGLWFNSLTQFGTNIAWLFLLTQLPRYLLEVHQVPIVERSWMVAMPPLAGVAGMFLGGQLTDGLTRRFGLRWGRALPMGLTRFGIATAYLCWPWAGSPWFAVALASLAFFFVDLGVASVWAYAQDAGGRHIGSVLGWGNMWGNLGAAVAPPLYNYLLTEHPTLGDWNKLFWILAAVATLAGITGLRVDATIPVEPESRSGGTAPIA
ncbi:MAG: MFS transporter [Planctomycetaceae bacterium]